MPTLGSDYLIQYFNIGNLFELLLFFIQNRYIALKSTPLMISIRQYFSNDYGINGYVLLVIFHYSQNNKNDK